MDTAARRLAYARDRIAKISALTLRGLDWRPAGPGPDAKVLLEARAQVDGGHLRLFAFRASMPVEAGWTRNPAWLDTRDEEMRFLVWDVERHKTFIERTDALPEDASEEEAEAVAAILHLPFDGEMERLQLLWDRLIDPFLETDSDFLPAMIEGAPYLIFGYSELGVEEPSEINIRKERRVSDREGAGRHVFPCVIEGMPGALTFVPVRYFRTQQESHLRPVGNTPANRQVLAEIQVLSEALGQDAHHGPIAFGRGTAVALMVPLEARVFQFDAARYEERHLAELDCGQGRVEMSRPLCPTRQLTQQIIEGLARAVREGRIARNGTAAFFTCPRSGIARDLGLKGLAPGEEKQVADDLIDHVAHTLVQGIWKDASGEGRTIDTSVASLVYATDRAIYVGLSNEFLLVANASRNGDLAGALKQGSSLSFYASTEEMECASRCLNLAPDILVPPIHSFLHDGWSEDWEDGAS